VAMGGLNVAVIALTSLIAGARLAGAGTVEAHPSQLDFVAEVGSLSYQANLEIYNYTGMVVTVSSLEFSSPSYIEYSGPTPPFTIDSGIGAWQDIFVACTPAQLGANDGTLSITTDAGTLTVPLTCDGKPSVEASPDPLAFGLQVVGTTPPYAYLSFIGWGATVTITTATLVGADAADFTVPLTAPFSVSDELYVSVPVTFHPSRVGDETAELDLQTDSALTPTVKVVMTGTGYEPLLAVSPSSIDFHGVSIGERAPSSVLITNLSATTQDVSFALTGADAAQFSITPSSASLPAGAAMTFDVTFAPAGLHPASAVLLVNPAIVPQTIQLTGTGLLADVDLAPAPLAFDDQAVGSTSAARTVTLTNRSAQALALREITSSDSQFVVNAALPATLAAGDSLEFTVTYQPASEGAQQAELTVYTDPPGLPIARLAVSGVSTSDGGCAAGTTSPGLATLWIGALAMLRRRRKGQRSCA
jgi:MYXO-CTERM domain-containing protein